jgi:hypothetical protein
MEEYSRFQGCSIGFVDKKSNHEYLREWSAVANFSTAIVKVFATPSHIAPFQAQSMTLSRFAEVMKSD